MVSGSGNGYDLGVPTNQTPIELISMMTTFIGKHTMALGNKLATNDSKRRFPYVPHL